MGAHWGKLLVAACVLGGCSDLPDVSPRCGDHVLEAGEECDTPSPGCGAPTSGAAACRFTCNGAPCPSGMACGSDQICRRPTGGFHLGPLLGGAGDVAQPIDLDGDGATDVATRGGEHLTLLTNDGRGGFTPSASGTTVRPNDGALGFGRHTVDIARSASDPRALLALTAPGGPALYARDATDGIDPLIYATELADPSSGLSLELRGAVRFGFASDGEMLLYDARSQQLTARPLDTTAMIDPPDATLDLARCGTVSGAPATTIATARDGTSRIAIVLGGASACVAATVGDAQGTLFDFSVTPLPLAAGMTAIQPPLLLGDFDGDGELDVMGAVTHVDAAGMESHVGVIWRWAGGAYADPMPVADPDSIFTDLTDFLAGDFDGDHATDLVSGSAVLLNRFVRSDGGALEATDGGVVAGGFVGSGPLNQVGSANSIAAVGDIDRDGTDDLIYIPECFTGTSATVCLSLAGQRWTCVPVETALPAPPDGAIVADVDGDGTNDVVYFTGEVLAPAATDGGVVDAGAGSSLPASGLTVLYGRPLALPDPTPHLAQAFAGNVTAVAPLFDRGVGNDNVLAALRPDDLTLGVAFWSPPSVGTFSANIPFLADQRLVDVTGDGLPDLLGISTDFGVSVMRRDPAHGFSGVVPRQIADLSGSNGAVGAFVTLPDDPLPAYLDVPPAPPVTQIDVGHLSGTGDGVKLDVTQVPLQSDQSDMRFLDTFAVLDLDGDGRNEVVVILGNFTGDATSDCRVFVGIFAPGTATPSFGAAVDVTGCADDEADIKPLFLDLTGDGVLDLVYPRYHTDGRRHLDVLPGVRGAGSVTFDASAPTAAPAPLDPTFTWLATADFNGDGIADALVATPLGPAILFADVTRP